MCDLEARLPLVIENFELQERGIRAKRSVEFPSSVELPISGILAASEVKKSQLIAIYKHPLINVPK